MRSLTLAAALLVSSLGLSGVAHADRYDRGGNGWRPAPGWNSNFGLHCASEGYGYNFCSADIGGHGRVSLGRQVSKTRCVRGQNWGYNRAGVWVNDGCEADFRVTRRW